VKSNNIPQLLFLEEQLKQKFGKKYFCKGSDLEYDHISKIIIYRKLGRLKREKVATIDGLGIKDNISCEDINTTFTKNLCFKIRLQKHRY